MLNEANKAKREAMGGDFEEYLLAIRETGGLAASLAHQDRMIATRRAELDELTKSHTAVREDANIPERVKASVEVAVTKKVATLLAAIESHKAEKVNLRNLADAGLIQ